MLTEISKSDKIGLGYRIFFEGAKRIVMLYFNFKSHQITLLLLLPIFICVNSAHAGWSTPRRISEVAAGYYPQIIAQGDTLHMVYINEIVPARICYRRSTDAGQTWSQRKVLMDTLNTGSPLNPHIIRWGIKLIALWLAYIRNQVYPYNIGYATSTNDGTSWSVPRYVLSPNIDWPFQFAVSNYNSLVNIIAECTAINDSAYYSDIRSTNFGQSWSVPQPMVYQFHNGIPDMANYNTNFYFIWDGNLSTSQTYEIRCNKSSNGGISWSEDFILSDSDQFHSQLPSITATAVSIICTWMDYKYSPYIDMGDILLRQSPDSGQSWSSIEQVTFDHFAWGSDIASMGDTLAVAWEDQNLDNGYGSIYCIKSTNGGQSWDEPFWVDGDTGYSRNTSIACVNGKIYLIWYDMQLPDSAGVYFSRYDFEQDAVQDNNNDNMPDKMSLSAYPNPFNSSVNIIYSSKKGGEIKIYSISGQLLRGFNVEAAEDGIVVWDGKNNSGKRVTSGTYLMRFLSDGTSKTFKLVYLK